MARPLLDRVEVAHPGVARAAARTALRLPPPLRRRVIAGAFARAEAAFNRHDLAPTFAGWADDVVYDPPPPLPGAGRLVGRDAVAAFWDATFERFPESRIENLEVQEAGPGVIRRRARLHHVERDTGRTLDYTILQVTRLRDGTVVEQTNELLG